MAGWQQAESSVYHKPSNANMGLQLNYNFDHRYYVEASAALVHSAKLAEGHRQKISPSLTLGWRAVRNRGAIDDMVLSVSGSILNQDVDIEDYYLYASSWNRDYGWEWFTAQNLQYTFSERGANENLTYVQRRELSANLRTSLWNNSREVKY